MNFYTKKLLGLKLFRLEHEKKTSLFLFLSLFIQSIRNFSELYEDIQCKAIVQKRRQIIMQHLQTISVLNSVSKVVEKVLSNQVREFLESNNLLTKFQYGFRKKKRSQWSSEEIDLLRNRGLVWNQQALLHKFPTTTHIDEFSAIFFKCFDLRAFCPIFKQDNSLHSPWHQLHGCQSPFV